LNKQSPAYADFERYFEAGPASVNSMIKKLEQTGLIAKESGQPRSIELLLGRDQIPDLE
jgi:Mn-dependent DtxR family transcriptional regulator